MIGQTLDRYQIIEQIGKGGMGTVYRARHRSLPWEVAVKVMHDHLVAQHDFRARFKLEAQVLANLDHPGIVRILDFEENAELLYIVMEFLPGGNLKELLERLRTRKEQIALPDAVDLVRQMALALDYAHRQGVLHRDIKPANIMLKPDRADPTRCQPVITDMGLAKITESSVVTLPGIAMGTPSYMAPEQALGKRELIGPATDLYALGVLLYELAVGELPYTMNTLSDAFTIHLKGAPPPAPRTRRPELPERLAAIIMQALANDPAKRFAGAAELAAALAETAVTTIPETVIDGATRLMTLYEQQLAGISEKPAAAPEPVIAPTIPGSESAIVGMQIREPDGQSRFFKLADEQVTVGRISTNALTLQNDLRVSRQHARIEFDGTRYRVTDLDSGNGTFLDNKRLLPGVPEPWAPEQILRIGRYELTLTDTLPAEPPAKMPGAVTPEQAAPDVAPALQPQRLLMSLSPTRKRSAEPGHFQLTIRNQSERTLPLRLSAQSEGSQCTFHFETTRITVDAGAEIQQNVRIHLASAARKGIQWGYRFTVRAEHITELDLAARAEGEWIYVPAAHLQQPPPAPSPSIRPAAKDKKAPASALQQPERESRRWRFWIRWVVVVGCVWWLTALRWPYDYTYPILWTGLVGIALIWWRRRAGKTMHD